MPPPKMRRYNEINLNVENDLDSWTHTRNSLGGSRYYSQDEKRAYRNALGRQRRDHIKECFTSFKNSVPALRKRNMVSQALILNTAARYIRFMQRKTKSHLQDIEDLKRQNSLLETQIRALEKALVTGNFAELGLGIQPEGSSHDTDSSDGEGTTRRGKKLKINGVIAS